MGNSEQNYTTRWNDLATSIFEDSPQIQWKTYWKKEDKAINNKLGLGVWKFPKTSPLVEVSMLICKVALDLMSTPCIATLNV